MTHAAQVPVMTAGPDGNGVRRGDRWLPRASPVRRGWARVLDGVFVVLFAIALVTAIASISGDTGAAIAISYPVAVLAFGALYGCTVSPGQALVGVVSLRCVSGRRVGFWRGMGRYLFIGTLPVSALMLLGALLDLPAADESIRVYRRAPDAWA